MELNPCCVYFNPLEDNNYIIGYYHLNNNNNQYFGGFQLFNYQTETLISEEFSQSGIFDFKWINNDKIITSQVNNQSNIFKINNNKFILENSFDLIDKGIYVEVLDNLAYYALENGHIEVINLENNKNIFNEKRHTYATWYVKPIKSHNMLISGNDDGSFYISELNNLENKIKKKTINPDYGITVIEQNQSNLNHLLIGDFNGNLYEYDLRNMDVLLKSSKLEGGIWRIKQKQNYFLFCLSHSENFELSEFKENNFSLLKKYEEHNSLAYAGDIFLDNNKINLITSSFYDKKTIKWSVNI